MNNRKLTKYHRRLTKLQPDGRCLIHHLLEKDGELGLYAYEYTLETMPFLEALVLLKHNLEFPDDPYIKEGDNLRYFMKMFNEREVEQKG